MADLPVRSSRLAPAPGWRYPVDPAPRQAAVSSRPLSGAHIIDAPFVCPVRRIAPRSTLCQRVYGIAGAFAALQAAALRDCLARGDHDLARRFFRPAAKPVGTAWKLAAGENIALPQVEGPRPLPVRIINAYIYRYQAASEHRHRLHRTVLQGRRPAPPADPPALPADGAADSGGQPAPAPRSAYRTTPSAAQTTADAAGARRLDPQRSKGSSQPDLRRTQPRPSEASMPQAAAFRPHLNRDPAGIGTIGGRGYRCPTCCPRM